MAAPTSSIETPLRTQPQPGAPAGVPVGAPAGLAMAPPPPRMPTLVELRQRYPGFVSLAAQGGFSEQGGIQPGTTFEGAPASSHGTQIPGGPLHQLVLADRGHSLVVLRDGKPAMTTAFSTNEGEAMLYCMSNGTPARAVLLWDQTDCYLQIGLCNRPHTYKMTNELAAWHSRRGLP